MKVCMIRMDRDDFLKYIAKLVVACNIDNAFILQEIYGTVNIEINIKVGVLEDNNTIKQYNELGKKGNNAGNLMRKILTTD